MKRRFWIEFALCLGLMLGIAVWGGRLMRLAGDARWDVGGGDAATLSASTVEYLGSMRQRLDLALFVSERRKMPSHLKNVEAEAVRLLEALKRQAPGRVDYRVIDPDLSGAAGLAYAARRRVSPLSVRRVHRDEQSAERVWSSLVLRPEGRPDILIQDIGAEDLPYLEELVMGHLEASPPPLLAVAGGPGFGLLPRLLEQYGRVVEVDLEQARIPPEADVLFWMQPRRVTPAHVRSLRAFVASGRSAVLAGSLYGIQYGLEEEGPVQYRVRGLDPGWGRLLGAFGLRPVDDLLLDRNRGPVPVPTADGRGLRPVEAAFHLRCLPAFRDMRRFAQAARGGLNFVAASPLEFAPRQAAEAGFDVQIVATTTEHARVLPLPEGPFTDADLEAAVAVPRQNLMLLLEPRDGWSGRLLVAASASPFRDGILNQEGYGHGVFLRNLVRTFAAPERLVRARIQRRAPPPLEGMPGPGARLGWRLWAVGAVPLFLLVLGWRRYGGEWPRWRPGGKGLAWGLGGLTLLALGGRVWPSGGGFDLSASGRNTPSPQLIERLAAAEGLQAEWFGTPRAGLPPALKGIEAEVKNLFDRAGVEVQVRRPGVDALPVGLGPFVVERVVEDTVAAQSVYSGLRLRRGGREAVVPRLDGQSRRHLDYLVAAALERLEDGRAPRLAVVGDLPRLSPAEALEDFQKKGLSPPTGTDVYGRAKALLGDYGFDVEHVHPRTPALPAAADAVLWLQPRRDSGPVLVQLAAYLAGGGRAVVALQHFNIQQRQYRGAGFQTVYWPQPQFQDFDRYSRLFGVEQVREVLMDRTRHHLQLDTQVNRTAVREYDPQQVALPFLIRAVGAHYAPSPLTRHLGDLLFVWGNRFALDQEKLATNGIAARSLVWTSPRVWSYDWSGGWLPPEAFSPAAYLPGPQPLVLQLEGRFPPVEFVEGDDGRQRLAVSGRARAEGMLLLIGASEMFKNDRLHAEGFDHAQLLLNAVVLAAQGPQTAALLTRQPAPQGFAFRSGGTKLLWRLAVVGAGPLVLGLCGAWRYARRQRPSEWA